MKISVRSCNDNRSQIPLGLEQIEVDLARKMLFIAGPRQVGKTTLGLQLPNADSGYLNWDIVEHRESIATYWFGKMSIRWSGFMIWVIWND